MLILTRAVGQEVIIPTSDGIITISLHSITGRLAKIAFDAPRHIEIMRAELLNGKPPESGRKEVPQQ